MIHWPLNVTSNRKVFLFCDLCPPRTPHGQTQVILSRPESTKLVGCVMFLVRSPLPTAKGGVGVRLVQMTDHNGLLHSLTRGQPSIFSKVIFEISCWISCSAYLKFHLDHEILRAGVIFGSKFGNYLVYHDIKLRESNQSLILNSK